MARIAPVFLLPFSRILVFIELIYLPDQIRNLMLTNKEAKVIKSLQLKKYRNKEKLFVVEGEKNLLELIRSDMNINNLYLTEKCIEDNADELLELGTQYEVVLEKELVRAGSFQSNSSGLAIVEIPEYPRLTIGSGYYLVFDNIQDPGNLGTIIRIADWYGFTRVICSLDSVDAYNPKVISATMGSFARVKVYYEDLTILLANSQIPIYGATLSGSDIHQTQFDSNGILLFGNESKGVRDVLFKYFTNEIKIPGYGRAESLNVAVATAVVCDNFRRLTS